MIRGAKTARAWSEWEGQIIDGKFPLLGYLGGSDHSAVFLTERPQGEPRRAAIKLLPGDDVAAEALLARWKVSAQLSHPDLLRLFETGRGSLGDVAFAYVLMEYAEENLSQVDRPLTATEAADMLEGALKALSYLHGKQLAHGQLKPSNILAVADQLKISSDTIRPAGEWRGDLDVPGQCDPPEIAQAGASYAGDVWSLGVTLVEAVTKQLPSWNRGAVAESVLDGLPPLFRVPVSNCLRLDPRQRWTAADLAESIRPKTEMPVRSPKEPSRPRSAKGRYLLAAGAVGLALAATVIVLRLTSDRVAPARPAVEPQELEPGPVTRQPAPQDVQPPEVEPRKAAPNSPAKSLGHGITMQVLPDVPAKARNTIRGKVTVNIRVGIDVNGSVVTAQNESPDSSRFFGDLALQAARRWKFEPADTGSSAHPAEWNLHFQFVRDARHPVSVKAAPAR
jgi:TonB family protein